jgi:hypothetical protein
MAVDASKLKRRRGLGAPPTEGAPGIEESDVARQEQAEARAFPQPAFLDQALSEGAPAEANPPPPFAEPATAQPEPAVPAKRAEGEGADAEPAPPKAEPEHEPELGAELEPAIAPRRAEAPSARRGGGGEAGPTRRQRVPPPEAEPRVPFTTRVTVSTKERLEDACYHLRKKHQDFINEAILVHLKKHGF